MHIGKVVFFFFLINCILKLFLSHPHPSLPHLHSLFLEMGVPVNIHFLIYNQLEFQLFKFALLCRFVLIASVYSNRFLVSHGVQTLSIIWQSSINITRKEQQSP